MGWDRQPSETVAAPLALSPARWLAALAIAGLAGVSLFLLHASQRLALLQSVNIWLFAFAPLLLVALAFAVRAFRYGGTLSHHAFLADEAQLAQESWETWTGRYLTVHDSCALLPERVSGALLAKGVEELSLHTGQARRLSMLPDDPFDRIQLSLLRLLEALQPSLEELGAKAPLRATLLCDAETTRGGQIAESWRRVWINVMGDEPWTPLIQETELSLARIDEKIRTGEPSLELILVVQTEGGEAYSDALAALLVCLDTSPAPGPLPVKARLLRPMPLDISDLQGEVAEFMQSQRAARSATGLLADVAQWQQASAPVLAASQAADAALKAEQQWIQERYSGVPGPFSSWAGLALGIELVQHRQEALLVLGKEQDRQWLSTLTGHKESA